MSQLIEHLVPDIGGHENVDVIDVAVAVGDSVEIDDTLITLETDKATMDVPATVAGVVKEVKVKTGDKISEAGLIVILEGEEKIASVAVETKKEPELKPSVVKPVDTPAPVAEVSEKQEVVSIVAKPQPSEIDEGSFALAHAGIV